MRHARAHVGQAHSLWIALLRAIGRVLSRRIRQARYRLIATVGRLDELDGAVQSLLSGLLRSAGLPGATTDTNAPPAPDRPGTPSIRFDPSLAYGDVFALDRLWHELDVDENAILLRSARLSFDAEALVRAMVFNRLCDASSKLGLLRWLQTASLPGVDAAEVTHQRLLRTGAALVSRLLRPLIEQRLSVVVYELTTIRAESLSEQPGELRRFRLAKEGVNARQCLLSVDNLAMLDALKVAGGPLEYIGGTRARHAEFGQVLEEVHPLRVAVTAELAGEAPTAVNSSPGSTAARADAAGVP